MIKALKIGAFFFAIMLLVLVSVLFTRRNSNPVILCASLDDTIRPRDHCLMNPFRDKSPEAIAEVVLQQLNQGNTDILLPYLSTLPPDRKEHILDNEKKYRIINWRIGGRTDADSASQIMYWVSRDNYGMGVDYLEEVYFFLEFDGMEWRLTHYTAIY